MSSSPPSHSCLVSVVGFTAHGNTYEGSSGGVGKSCLCSRFCYGGVDDYVSDHPSIMALHEFESQVISTDHFIYWGPHSMTHTLKGGKQVTVKYEVVEHTIFYHDETSQPFPNLRKLTVPLNYAKKIAYTPESSRKISYYARDAIGFPDKYCCMPYPSNPSRIPRGFILVIDLSIKDYQFEYQLTAAETIIFELKKSIVVVAATKRDIANPSSLVRLTEWAYKHKLTVVQTSAKEDVNVEDVFRVMASKVLTKKVKLDDSFLDYAQGSGYRLACRTKAKRDFKNNLHSFVQSASVSMNQIETLPVYQNALKALGKFVTDEILASFLLSLRNKELDSCFGADDPEMRTEMLEDFIEGNLNFGPHKKALYTQINSLINPGQAVYVNETFQMPSPTAVTSPSKSPQKSPEKYVRLVPNQQEEEKEEEEEEEEEKEEEEEEGEEEEGQKEQVEDCDGVQVTTSSSVIVEEVYDKFDGIPPPSNGAASQLPVNELSNITLREKAFLLKQQLAKSLQQEQQIEQQIEQQVEEEYEIPVNVKSNKESPPPPIPSKPKNYQKWRLKKEEETTVPPQPSSLDHEVVPSGVQETTKATPPTPPKPKNYPKWKPKQQQETGANLPPSSPTVRVDDTVMPQDSPSPAANNSPTLLIKGYQLWQPNTNTEGITVTQSLPQSGTPPQVPRKSYEKTSIKKYYEKREILVLPPVESSLPKPTESSSPKLIIESSSPKPTKKNDNYKPMLPILREKQRLMSLANTTASDTTTATTNGSSPIVATQQHSPPLPVSSHAGMTPPGITKHHLPPPPPPPPPPPSATPSTLANTTITATAITTNNAPSSLTPVNLKQQRPFSVNVTSSSPPLRGPLPGHSPSLGSIATHQQQQQGLSPSSSPAHSSPSPPPIPPHTTQMLETKDETSPKKAKPTSPSKRHNYFNTILKPFKKKSRSLDDTAIPSPRKPLVNMRNRILPPEPLQRPPMHGADDYERPDEFLSYPHHRQPMPLPPGEHGLVHPMSPPQTIQEHYYDDPTTAGNADPNLLNHAWILSQRIQQERTKNLIRDDTLMPYYVGGGLPKRTQSFQYNYRLNTTTTAMQILDDSVDEEGYQKTDEIEDIRQTRTLPRVPSDRFDSSFEYDYPNIRGFRAPPRRNVMTPPRSGDSARHRPLIKEESYVNMDIGGSEDYQNSEVIKAMLDSVSPKRVPPRSAHGSLDDMSIYYNLRERGGLFSPPRTPEHPKPPVIKPKPVLPPKTKDLPPAKTRSFTMITDTSSSNIVQVDEGPSKKRGSFQSQESLIDAETGQKKKKNVKNLTLPPRNIPRPGFSASEYTPII